MAKTREYDGVLGRGGLCKTRAFDGLCWEGYHEFEESKYSLKESKHVMIDCKIEISIPLESCKHCGLLRLVPKEDEDGR